MKKIGLIGGTFDPPHNGHLLIAQEVLIALSLDEIWFIPSNIPPHKSREITSSKHRIEMVKRAIESNDNFKINLIEFEREGRSYTVDTIKVLKELYKEYTFYFIIGSDMVEYLPKWHEVDELMKLIQFVGMKRPGYEMETKYPLIQIEAPQIDLSSTSLRERCERGGNTVYLLPENVKTYIEENNLYGS
ncbi:nicotinate-nucleotide adenylyltransferase [Bacillus solimangrovi]|uniref:Probable nicotinate-nucleotide adenylyltransferase n=1 Tax=Bacillus solimangrovi TaxID=1305675 RepID=A0A1E5LHW0_9BACI|nr:nicotinate-nucleotide adenylyltransferase [Bacillus solimangrovi]OEH93674.1 nicotinic acid mononucleotide adenylyltransferase [Bacillus solimangrovi]